MDPLDAFMAAEVMPEVKVREKEEQQRRQQEKQLLAKQLAVGVLLQGVCLRMCSSEDGLACMGICWALGTGDLGT